MRIKDYCIEVNLVRLKPLISVIRRPDMQCPVQNPPAAGSAIARHEETWAELAEEDEEDVYANRTFMEPLCPSLGP